MLFAEKRVMTKTFQRAARFSAAPSASSSMRTKTSLTQNPMSASSADFMGAKKFCVAILLLLVLFSIGVFAHEGEDEEEEVMSPISYLPIEPFFLASVVFPVVLLLVVVSIFFQNSLSDKTKKIIFIAVAVPVVLTTLYLAGSTVYLNIISESGGPVHWHADFEIWNCGEHVTNLKKPEYLSNKVGSDVFHSHDDFRIHIEGIVVKKSDVSLGNFFEVIGGHFSGGHLEVELDNGTFLDASNGDLCPDGASGKWRLFLKNHSTGQFEENTELDSYVIKPFFNIPPGDYLLLVFGSTEGVPNGS